MLSPSQYAFNARMQQIANSTTEPLDFDAIVYDGPDDFHMCTLGYILSQRDVVGAMLPIQMQATLHEWRKGDLPLTPTHVVALKQALKA